jgi:hypothetical protein
MLPTDRYLKNKKLQENVIFEPLGVWNPCRLPIVSTFVRGITILMSLKGSGACKALHTYPGIGTGESLLLSRMLREGLLPIRAGPYPRS